jgi:hypothetical protein
MDQEREDYADPDLDPAAVMSLRRLALVLLIALSTIGAGLAWCWFGVLLPSAYC